MRLLLAMALLLQAAPAPTQAERTEAALKKMTDREYRMLAGDKELGAMTMKHKIDVLEFSSFNKGYELKCTERTTLEFAGTKHDAFKWRLSGETRMDLPSGPMVAKVVYNFWVNPEGVLLRYTMDIDDRKNENALELKSK